MQEPFEDALGQIKRAVQAFCARKGAVGFVMVEGAEITEEQATKLLQQDAALQQHAVQRHLMN